MKLHTLIVKKHVKGCRALKHVKNKKWSHVWFIDWENPIEWGTERGLSKKIGHTVWINFICNISDCKGRAVVRHDDVAKLMGQK